MDECDQRLNNVHATRQNPTNSNFHNNKNDPIKNKNHLILQRCEELFLLLHLGFSAFRLQFLVCETFLFPRRRPLHY